MNKLFQMLFVLLSLWLIAYGISYFFEERDIGNKIAVIPIKGMITYEGSSSLFSSTSSGTEIIEKLKEAEEDDNIKAIILDINSPGGSVVGSKLVADKIKTIEKPVVAYISEYGASGSYWIASQSDIIVADELSFVGSISVVGSHLEFSGLLEDYNITYRQLTTGEYKEIGSPYREMTKQEQELLMERMQGIHDYFVREVAEGRNLSVEEVEQLSNGLFYLGYEAKDLNLVDELGNKDKAIEVAKNLAGLKEGNVKEFTEEKTFWGTIKQYTAQSSYFIGQGIGSVLIQEKEDSIHV